MNEQNTAPVKVFSAAGRIGRLRYIAWNLLATIIFLAIYLVAAILFGAMAGAMSASGSPEGAMMSGGLIFLVLFVLMIFAAVLKFLWTIQRAHDMNVSGWLSLIILVPLGEFVFWFAPGTDGENNYGPPPPSNGAGVIVTVVLVPFVMVFGIGILAAIAIPAYEGYLRAAEEAAALERQDGYEAPAYPYEQQYVPLQNDNSTSSSRQAPSR